LHESDMLDDLVVGVFLLGRGYVWRISLNMLWRIN